MAAPSLTLAPVARPRGFTTRSLPVEEQVARWEHHNADALVALSCTPPRHAGLAALRAEIDAPTALRDYGMVEEGIPEATQAILAHVPVGNPAEITTENLTALLRDAWEGAPIR